MSTEVIAAVVGSIGVIVVAIIGLIRRKSSISSPQSTEKSRPAEIIVERKWQLTGSALSLSVYIDQARVGYLRTGEYKTFRVSSGNHSVYVEMSGDGATCNLPFLEEGETKTVTAFYIPAGMFYDAVLTVKPKF